MLEFGTSEVCLDSTLGEIASPCWVTIFCQVIKGFFSQVRTVSSHRGRETVSADKGGVAGLKTLGHSYSFGISQMFPVYSLDIHSFPTKSDFDFLLYPSFSVCQQYYRVVTETACFFFFFLTRHWYFTILTLLIYFQLDTASTPHIPSILHALWRDSRDSNMPLHIRDSQNAFQLQNNEALVPSFSEVHYCTMKVHGWKQQKTLFGLNNEFIQNFTLEHIIPRKA